MDHKHSKDLIYLTNSIHSTSQTLASLISDLAPPELTGELSTIMHILLDEAGEKPFMKRTVREMLFDGWSLQPYIDILETLYNETDIELPPLPPLPEDPRFGFFYGVFLSE